MAYAKTADGQKVPYIPMAQKTQMMAQQQAEQKDAISVNDIEQDTKTFYQKYKLYIFIALALIIVALGAYFYLRKK